MSKEILVGLSGGVDSAVCVQLLRNQGYNVHGAFICFSPAHVSTIPAAEQAAQELGVPLHIIDGQALFESDVIQPFCGAYCKGETPNPCVICNPRVKFRLLCEKADELGIHHIATGHYARLETVGEHTFVRMAHSAARDQSYMLYRLPQEVLQRLVLPLGEHEKDDIRAMASAAALSAADAPDSQEICFIPSGDYAAYIEQRGMQSPQGNFISPTGEDLGAHKGILHYTVGQRRRLHIALGKPVFVREISSNGDIYLGFAGEEFSPSITLTDTVWATSTAPYGQENLLVKIRSAAKPVPCTLTQSENGALVTFAEPARAPAPGQSAVIYSGELALGGGFIK